MSVQQHTASSIAASFDEAVLHSPCVCRNCLRIVREERERQPEDAGRFSTQTARQSVSLLTRERTTTELDHTPGGSPTDSHVTWCECGVESAYHQERDDRVGRDRLETFLVRLDEICQAKGITINRDRMVERALELERDTVGPGHRYAHIGHADCPFCEHEVMTTDEILAEALEYGITTAP